MENSQKPTRVQRSELEIRAILKEQESNNVPVKAVCKIYGIHEATFYSWRNRFGPRAKNSSEFIEMEIGQIDTEPSLLQRLNYPVKWLSGYFRRSSLLTSKPYAEMIHLSDKCSCLLYSGQTDMRKSFHGLAKIVKQDMK